MKKKGNITFILLVALLTVCCGASIISVAANSKYNARTEYERLRNRYIAESGIDTAVGLFLNYLENQDYVLAYTKHETGDFSVIDEYSPYLLSEIKNAPLTADEVNITLISAETKAYLISVGFADFKAGGDITLKVSTFGEKEKFKLSRMCTQPDFLINMENEEQKSKLNPIYLNVSATYNGGEVSANVKISGLYAVREPFEDTETIESVSAAINADNAKIEYMNYQNYAR